MAVFGALYAVPGLLPIAVAVLIVWAVSSDIFMPSQQRRMVELAPEVRGLVLALNSSAIYVGMAMGSFSAGGLTPSLGVAGLPLVSVGFLALSLMALQLSRRAATPCDCAVETA
jgi:DHA1 family inner membrane transport protein